MRHLHNAQRRHPHPLVPFRHDGQGVKNIRQVLQREVTAVDSLMLLRLAPQGRLNSVLNAVLKSWHKRAVSYAALSGGMAASPSRRVCGAPRLRDGGQRLVASALVHDDALLLDQLPQHLRRVE